MVDEPRTSGPGQSAGPPSYDDPRGPRHRSTSERTTRAWQIIPPHLRHIFLPQRPEEQLLPDEEVELEIHLAWYRDILGVLIYRYWAWVLAVTIIISSLMGATYQTWGLDITLAMQIPFIILIGLVLIGLFQHFTYSQWRIIKTNSRLIISMPQPGTWFLVDNIEMTSAPKVIDANWSDSGGRRMLQAITGARDLYISLAGLQFESGTARVKDAIIIPDVNDEDVQMLKMLVFRPNSR